MPALHAAELHAAELEFGLIHPSGLAAPVYFRIVRVNMVGHTFRKKHTEWTI